MKKTIFVLLFLYATFSFSQVVDTPPFHGADLQSADGQGLNRMGKVVRYSNFVYPADVLAEWRKKRDFVDPSTTSGILVNPYRADGTSLNYGLGIPSNFTGHIPVYTEGNKWPYIGPVQGDPGSYGNLETDTGVYFQKGKPVATVEPLIVDGVDRVKVYNKTGYSYLITAGNFPGNEQPGQVMTVISPNGAAPLPIPPKNWWVKKDGTSLVPEMYASVAGLNPLDAPGWKNASWSPRYPGGVQSKDYGTAGFAYTFGSLYGRNSGGFDLSNVLFAGFHTNEGYDPIVSGDPGYGCAFYIDGNLEAVMDITLNSDPYTANAVMVAKQGNNPNAAQGGLILSSIIGVQPGKIAELHFITHQVAYDLISLNGSKPDWKKVTKTYQSNTQAVIENLALPEIVPASGTVVIPTGSPCGVFGLSYINNTTARVYHKKENTWTNPTQIYACINSNCYVPKIENGYYYFDFDKLLTPSVDPILNQTYKVEFKLSNNGQYFSTGETSIVFKNEACSFLSSLSIDSISGETSHFYIYPNPISDGMLHIVSDETSINYTLFTIEGRKILSGNEKNIDVSKLSSGIFTLNTNRVKKLIIKL
jgi:hypothetical protein